EVNAFVYSLPECVNLASVELGWLATYQSRSFWCMPSTEISSTCLLAGAGACAAALAEPCNADTDSAHEAAAALAASHAKVFRLVTGPPVRADLFGTPKFLCSQGEIRVLVRGTPREPIEATCGFSSRRASSAPGARITPAAHRGQHLYRRGR